MSTRPVVLHALVVLFGATACAAAAPQEIRVPRWQPYDVVFRSAARPENPFLLPFSATVTRPDGAEFTTLGFCDGQGTWKLRVTPNAEGTWSLVTHSTAPDLDGRRDSFVCVANTSPNIHGAVRVDPEHPRHFVFEDGTRYFPMGYECDWLWALDMEDPALKTLNPFLDKLAAHGFNFMTSEPQYLLCHTAMRLPTGA